MRIPLNNGEKTGCGEWGGKWGARLLAFLLGLLPVAHVATAVSNVEVARGVRIAETRGPHDGAQHALGCLCGWIGWAVRRRWLHGGLDVCVGGLFSTF